MNAFTGLKAVRTALEPLAYPTHLVFADKVTEQYLVLSSPALGDSPEPPLAIDDTASSFEFRVKAVAGTPEGVSIMLSRILAILSPGRIPTVLPCEGWSVFVRFVRAEFIDVDDSTTTPGTNRHPAFGVDTYHLTAQPDQGATHG